MYKLSLVSTISQNKTNRISFIILLGIVISNFAIGDFNRNQYQNVIVEADDFYHLNIADNFRKTGNFDLSFVFTRYTTFTPQYIVANNPDIPYPEDGKPPFFYIILGTVFKIFSSDYDELFLHATLLNNFLTSIFLILFFLLIKKKFDLYIATFSTFLVLMLPLFGLINGYVGLYPLLLTLSISSLFFLEKKKSHYLLFALFASLAHLTHPTGVILIFSYMIFLLTKREIRGLIILYCTWTIFLIPWFIRNNYYFNDIGRGLYLPLSSTVSQILPIDFLPHTDQSQYSSYITSSGLSNLTGPLPVLNTLFEYSISLFGMHFFIVFVLAFSSITFFKLHKSNFSLKKIFLIVLVWSILYVLLSLTSSYAQIFVLFIIPIILVVFLKLKMNHIFENNLRLPTLIMILSVVSIFVFYFYAAVTNMDSMHPLRIILPLVLLIPLSFAGIQKLIPVNPRFLNHNKIKILTFLSIIIISSFFLIPSAYQLYDNYNWVSTKNSDFKVVNQYILDNIPPDEVLASNLAGYAWSVNGHNSISFPSPVGFTPERAIEFDKFLDYYKIKYVVFYDPEFIRNDFNYIYQERFLNKLLYTPPLFHKLTNIMQSGNSMIYKIDDIGIDFWQSFVQDAANERNMKHLLHVFTLLDNAANTYEEAEHKTDFTPIKNQIYDVFKDFNKSLVSDFEILKEDIELLKSEKKFEDIFPLIIQL